MGITTKTGDDGTTSFPGGGRVPKDHPRIECLGALDELNALLGAARCAAIKPRTGEIIKKIQEEIITISGIIASGAATPANRVSHSITAQADGPKPAFNTKRLENWAAELESILPPLRNFIIPGENPASAQLHIARTLCRRAERRLVSLNHAAPVPPELLRYMNRLSDLLFLLARDAEH
ncbi:ATP--cob(I)alamin adenosyltransferase [Bacilli bacterium]|nr:ATP--cob(I)alamin adenosyltransferase [Bacilli bacterium]